MANKTKQIASVSIPGAIPMKASALNAIRLAVKHTVLTPEVLAQASVTQSAGPSNQSAT